MKSLEKRLLKAVFEIMEVKQEMLTELALLEAKIRSRRRLKKDIDGGVKSPELRLVEKIKSSDNGCD